MTEMRDSYGNVIRVNDEAVVSAISFDFPWLTMAKVKVVKIKRKYAIVEYKNELYEIPKSWLIKDFPKLNNDENTVLMEG